MFFEISSLTYHSPITTDLLIYRMLTGTNEYSSIAGLFACDRGAEMTP